MRPPTSGALKYSVYRAHYISLLWKRSCTDAKPFIEGGVYEGRTTDLFPAPEATIAMTVCECKSGCKTGRCKCKKNKLVCTEMCICVECENVNESVSI